MEYKYFPNGVAAILYSSLGFMSTVYTFNIQTIRTQYRHNACTQKLIFRVSHYMFTTSKKRLG
jgi:hypothetical protein